MDYISGLGNSVTGAFGSAAQSAANVAPSNGLSSFFGKADEKEQDTPAPGSATNAGPPAVGGRRKKQCGGSFRPYTPSSDLSSTASVFKGGKRKTYRKKSHRKSHKKSRRKSYRKRR
jgi:hypothetical protein